MVKIEFYVPETHIEEVKSAVFEAGGGLIGNYECCCWQTLGKGQFRPLAGSNPHIGRQGIIESVPEYKIELICAPDKIQDIITALKKAHPYEAPAYQFWEIKT
jgi:hypothetical protein